MGKRSGFERRKNDDYPTWDARAYPPLLAQLAAGTRFVEPCAGGMILADRLVAAGHVCALAYDIEPKRGDVQREDALTFKPSVPFDCFITNPPWTRELLHPLIWHLIEMAPVYLLFDADWKYTKQARPLMAHCHDIFPVGRLKWIPDSEHDGKDNCAWYLFRREPVAAARFHLRHAA